MHLADKEAIEQKLIELIISIKIIIADINKKSFPKRFLSMVTYPNMDKERSKFDNGDIHIKFSS